jgi:hypothetical protein
VSASLGARSATALGRKESPERRWVASMLPAPSDHADADPPPDRFGHKAIARRERWVRVCEGVRRPATDGRVTRQKESSAGASSTPRRSCFCGGASTSRQLVASRRNTADSRSCRRRTQSYATRCRRDRLAPEAFTEAGAESSSGTRLGGAAVGAPSRAREWRSGVPTAPSRRPAGYWAGPWRGKTSSMLVRHWRLSSAPTDR